MERLLLVHGSVSGGGPTWSAQRRLADRFELVVLERPGFPPGPPVDRVDFERDAAWIATDVVRPGDHVVGHSYGGVIALLATARRPADVASLTLIEPPATSVASGHAAVDAFAREGAAWWRDGPTDDPEAFLRGFLRFVGSAFDPPQPLPPALEQGARMLVVERGPWEAEIPLDDLAAAGIPALVVSGAHHPAFDAICDALEARLAAERLALPGFGHSPQKHPEFNDALAAFVATAARSR